jgi:hypothetical protein
MYMCVRGIKFAPVSMIFLLDSGIVLVYDIFCYSFYFMSFWWIFSDLFFIFMFVISLFNKLFLYFRTTRHLEIWEIFIFMQIKRHNSRMKKVFMLKTIPELSFVIPNHISNDLLKENYKYWTETYKLSSP